VHVLVLSRGQNHMSIDLFSSLIQKKDRILAHNIILMLGDPTTVPTFDALVLSDLYSSLNCYFAFLCFPILNVEGACSYQCVVI
jgi:hypothetical protein